jgi:uncharacterized protein (DUF39 family)
MSAEWIRGASFLGYGTSLTVGIGIPIPILNEEIVQYTAVKDEDIVAQIVDYSDAYPNMKPGSLGEIDYKSLKSGKIIVQGKEVPTSPLSSYSKAKQIATLLKEWIQKGEFLLGEPVQLLPSADSGYAFKPMKMRPIEEK